MPYDTSWSGVKAYPCFSNDYETLISLIGLSVTRTQLHQKEYRHKYMKWLGEFFKEDYEIYCKYNVEMLFLVLSA